MVKLVKGSLYCGVAVVLSQPGTKHLVKRRATSTVWARTGRLGWEHHGNVLISLPLSTYRERAQAVMVFVS